MTGYAALTGAVEAESGTAAAAALRVEVRAVNGRFLDLTLRLPDEADYWQILFPGTTFSWTEGQGR